MTTSNGSRQAVAGGRGQRERLLGAPWPRPASPRLAARWMYRLGRLLRPNAAYRWLAARLEASPALYRLFTAAEEGVKDTVFGCRMCGQCTLPVTGYACPMTCPKELRNGPCGGVRADGGCEVYPDQRCVWLVAYERAESCGRVADLYHVQRPLDHRRWGQSAWTGYWQDGDVGLWRGWDDGHGVPVDGVPVDGAGPAVAATAAGDR